MAGNKGLFGILQGAADSVISTVQDTVENVKTTVQDIKIPEVKIPEVKLPDINLNKIFGGTPQKSDTASSSDPGKIKTVSVKSAMKIIYYLMAVDGDVFHNEEEKFDEIGKELVYGFENVREELTASCRKQLESAQDQSDYFDVLVDGIREAIAEGANKREASIKPMVLVWDLLTTAYSDGNYDEKERRVLKYVIRKLDVDNTVFLEMESSFLTLMDLEKELTWVKNSGRSFLETSAVINEITKRKTVVTESVKELIAQ